MLAAAAAAVVVVAVVLLGVQLADPPPFAPQFQACSFYCRVWVNGKEVGQHRAGGYVAFSLPPFVAKAGANELFVLADNVRVPLLVVLAVLVLVVLVVLVPLVLLLRVELLLLSCYRCRCAAERSCNISAPALQPHHGADAHRRRLLALRRPDALCGAAYRAEGTFT